MMMLQSTDAMVGIDLGSLQVIILHFNTAMGTWQPYQQLVELSLVRACMCHLPYTNSDRMFSVSL
jgi:hypothetical protein